MSDEQVSEVSEEAEVAEIDSVSEDRPFYEAIGTDALREASELESDLWDSNEEVVAEVEEADEVEEVEVVEAATEELEEEPVVAAAEPEPEPEEPKSVKFDEMLEKEIGLREREAELKQKGEAFVNMDTFKDLARSNPMKFLEELGMTFDEFADIIIDEPQNKDPQVKELESRIEKFEIREQESRVNDYVRDLNAHVDNSNYDLIKGLEAQQLVIDTITQNWKDRGVQLSIDEACVLVEKHLTDVELPKLERIREITAKRAGSKEVKKLEVTRPVKKTLKNKAATKAPVRKVRGRISQEEAMADAIALEDALWE